MGKYYGLYNHTRHHKVSSYWKGAPPNVEELKQIAAILGWDLEDYGRRGGDSIVSYSYEDAHTWSKGAWLGPTDPSTEVDYGSEVEAESEPEVEVKWMCFGVAYLENDQISVRPELFDETFFCN